MPYSCRPASNEEGHPAAPAPLASLEEALSSLLGELGIPGFAGGLIRDRSLSWAWGYGLADVESSTPMAVDTLLNIGSVSKTVTATAVLQLIEQHRLGLDDDVDRHLGFSVRNPAHAELPITARQLLTHRSSILDGAPLWESYACGDPPTSLREWLKTYFSNSNTSTHFHQWPPGTVDPPQEPHPYSNVGYGVLGHLVERVSGSSFEDYTREHIFEPLGMASSGWRLSDINTARHATPYSRLSEDFEPPEDPGALLARYSTRERPPEPGALFPHCLYSFATPPDGLLRTSIADLSRFLVAWMSGGVRAGARILEAETVAMALSDQHFGMALCWGHWQSVPGEPLWGHSGGDPGIASYVGFRPEQGSGILLLFNTYLAGGDIRPVIDELFAQLE